MMQDDYQARAIMKLLEEIHELGAEIMKHMNKPHKDNSHKILSEVKDVRKWLDQVETIWSKHDDRQ